MKASTKCLALFFFYVTTLITAGAQSNAVDGIIKREMKERGIPGLQIAVVQHGKIALLKSYGYANLQDSITVTNKSIFAINSCTKAFTGVAIMQLVEEGRVELNTPVSRYLADLPLPWQAITIKQLLTHVSGLPDVNSVLNASTHGLGELATEAAAWEKVKALPMQFKTGEQFSYNQTNYALLGKIIDKLSGKPFAQVFSERQFTIANMRHTLFGDARDIIPHFAPTYMYKNKIDDVTLAERKLVNNAAEFPFFTRTASGLNSTAEDMANWIISLQKGTILKLNTLTTLWSPGTYNNGTPTQWAMGWGFTKFRTKHKGVGMTGGGRSAFIVYPDDDLAVVVLTNLLGGTPDDFIEEIAGCYVPEIAAADPITLLRTKLPVVGYEKAFDVVTEARKKNPDFHVNEDELNDWGYRLMSNGHTKEAEEIFKLNVTLFPSSWNPYDSYGEVLLKNGKKELAVKMYAKSIELNPDNTNGKKILERIEKGN